MRTPTGVTLEEFNAQLAAWLDRYATRRPATADGTQPSGWMCLRCGTTLANVRAVMSIHVLGGRCADGSGTRAKVMNIPYCPRCEHAPAYMGCVHVEDPAAELVITGGAHA